MEEGRTLRKKRVRLLIGTFLSFLFSLSFSACLMILVLVHEKSLSVASFGSDCGFFLVMPGMAFKERRTPRTYTPLLRFCFGFLCLLPWSSLVEREEISGTQNRGEGESVSTKKVMGFNSVLVTMPEYGPGIRLGTFPTKQLFSSFPSACSTVPDFLLVRCRFADHMTAKLSAQAMCI